MSRRHRRGVSAWLIPSRPTKCERFAEGRCLQRQQGTGTELKKKAEELAAATNPLDKEKSSARSSLDRLQNLKDTLDQQLNSQSLDADVQRAPRAVGHVQSAESFGRILERNVRLAEVDAGGTQAACQSDGGHEESRGSAQPSSLRKRRNNMKPLDGKDFGQLGDLAQYAAVCQGLCQSLIPGPGPNGSGFGYGPRRMEMKNLRPVFVRKNPAYPWLPPGEDVMEWKTREVSEAGPAREEYLRAVQDIRQQASEAGGSGADPARVSGSDQEVFRHVTQ